LNKSSVWVDYNTKNGTFSLINGEYILINEITSLTEMSDGTILDVKNYTTHITKQHGDLFSVKSSKDGCADIIQEFCKTDQGLTLEVILESEELIEVKNVTPIASTANSILFSNQSVNFLSVPYDNDDWVRYSFQDFNRARESYDVSAVMLKDEVLVIGSLRHDFWKTAIVPKESSLKVICGYTSKLTRDSLPHGHANGKKVSSDIILLTIGVGFEDTILKYSETCKEYRTPLYWKGDVPFGWNSFSAFPMNASLECFKKASNFFKNKIYTEEHFKGSVYINFDYIRDIPDEDLIQAVSYAKSNGQKAGFYYVPFATWKDAKHYNTVINTENGTTIGDILLRDFSGDPLPEVDGLVPLDPTHPENLKRAKAYIEKFLEMGYSYVKLDFLAHGAMEGNFYNKEITTGRQAYNYAMDYIKEVTRSKEIFISASIAPLFPYGYSHARRISCDCFGTLSDTEYMLNSLSWCYWLNDNIYAFNDPDHTVLYKSEKHDYTTEKECKARFLASVISGTVMMFSDDYSKNEVISRARSLLNSEDILYIIKSKKTFKPIYLPSGDKACEIFYLIEENSCYVCVFNFNKAVKTVTINLEEIGLSSQREYIMQKIYLGSKEKVKGNFQVTLDIDESDMLKIIYY